MYYLLLYDSVKTFSSVTVATVSDAKVWSKCWWAVRHKFIA